MYYPFYFQALKDILIKIMEEKYMGGNNDAKEKLIYHFLKDYIQLDF